MQLSINHDVGSTTWAPWETLVQTSGMCRQFAKHIDLHVKAPIARTWPDLLHWQLTWFLWYGQVILNKLPDQEQAVANQLTRSGYLVTEPSEADPGAFVVSFVSRLHMEYTRFCFYSRSYSTLAQMPTSMSDFLRQVLQRMSFAQMANSLNTSKSPSRGLLEAHYQNEFYR